MNDARQIEEQAALWLLRSEQPDWSELQQAELLEWLDQSYTHKAAFWRLEHGWGRADRLAALGEGQPAGAGRARAVPSWWPAAIAASIAFMIALGSTYFMIAGGFAGPAKVEVAEQRFSTALGARRTLALADGSKVELNTATLARARIDRKRREFWLDRGEAYFEIAHQAGRPFIVYAGPRTITVIGTKFSVRRDGDKVTVSVVEGRVRVDYGQASTSRPSATLSVGDTAVSDGNSTIVASRSLEQVELGMSWRKGMLTFNDETLAEAAAEFNRYNVRKIQILDEQAGEMRIGGTFEANNVDAFARLLREAYGVKVEVEPDAVKISA